LGLGSVFGVGICPSFLGAAFPLETNLNLAKDIKLIS